MHHKNQCSPPPNIRRQWKSNRTRPLRKPPFTIRKSAQQDQTRVVLHTARVSVKHGTRAKHDKLTAKEEQNLNTFVKIYCNNKNPKLALTYKKKKKKKRSSTFFLETDCTFQTFRSNTCKHTRVVLLFHDAVVWTRFWFHTIPFSFAGSSAYFSTDTTTRRIRMSSPSPRFTRNQDPRNWFFNMNYLLHHLRVTTEPWPLQQYPTITIATCTIEETRSYPLTLSWLRRQDTSHITPTTTLHWQSPGESAMKPFYKRTCFVPKRPFMPSWSRREKEKFVWNKSCQFSHWSCFAGLVVGCQNQKMSHTHSWPHDTAVGITREKNNSNFNETYLFNIRWCKYTWPVMGTVCTPVLYTVHVCI